MDILQKTIILSNLNSGENFENYCNRNSNNLNVNDNLNNKLNINNLSNLDDNDYDSLDEAANFRFNAINTFIDDVTNTIDKPINSLSYDPDITITNKKKLFYKIAILEETFLKN